MQKPLQKIRELRDLLNEGLLSEHEFELRKKAILDSEFAPNGRLGAPVQPEFSEQGTDLGFVSGQELGVQAKRFQLERLLGQGGMGQVWQVTDLATLAALGHSEKLALKILSAQFTQSAQHARLLIEEASLVRKLAHEHIVRVYDWGRDLATDRYFLMMEYLDGEDLNAYLRKHPRCTWTQVVQLLMPVAQALQYAWDKHKLVHRDLKPGNIVLTRQGQVKLVDFGISASLVQTQSTLDPHAGTTGYRAPEANHHLAQVTPALDVYAMAVMIYQMLEGTLPATEQRHSPQDLPPPKALSPVQWRVLQSGFAFTPSQRPASALALLETIQAVDQKKALGRAPQHESNISPVELAAQQRAEQRRLRKEWERQRRQQASAALHALVEKQNQLRHLEQLAQIAQRKKEAELRLLQNAQREKMAPPVIDRVQVSNVSWDEAQRYLAAMSQERNA